MNTDAPLTEEEFDDVADTSGLDEIEYFGEKEIRWFQIASRNGAIQAVEDGVRRILICQPTGCGKTLTIACTLSHPAMRKALKVPAGRKLRVLFAAHKHRLLTQAEATFAADNNVELITHSFFSDIPADVMEKGWDITVLDEAHHEACQSFQLLLEMLGVQTIIGLTATPDRADGLVIKFERIINPITREQAVDQGYLAPTFLNSIVDSPADSKVDVTKMIIDEFGHEFGQTMMFFRTKKEVRAVTAYLVEKGYEAVAILDQTERELDALLNEFGEGKHQFIVNCNKINEGVDVKGCSDVYLGRAYGSYPQLNQVIGRAARPDCACNVWELINPLSGRNLDTTVVVGTPERHRLIHKKKGKWVQEEFNYVGLVGGRTGLASGKNPVIM